MLLKLNEIVRDGIQLGQNTATALDGFQYVVADSLHLAVFESPGEDAAVPFHRPFTDGFIYQKVKESVVCRGYGAPEAGLLWVCRFLLREIIRLLQQVVGKWHRLRPGRFPKIGLFGHTPEIVVSEETHGGEVQTLGQAPDDLRCHLAKPHPAGFIRQQDPEEYGPVATPIPTDVVPNLHHVRRQQVDYLRDCGVDLLRSEERRGGKE